MARAENPYTEIVIDKANRLLKQNLHQTHDKEQELDYFSASPYYVDQFLWDSAFMAIAESRVDPQLAQAQIELMLAKQREDGFIPIINFWEKMGFFKRKFYSWYYDGERPLITQPPVLAIAQEQIFSITNDEEALLTTLPKLAKNIDYFLEKRDPDKDGLVSVIHPWELGIDLTPTGDRFLGNKKDHPGFVSSYIKMFSIFRKYKKMGWDEERILASNTYEMENVLFNVIVSEASRSVARLYYSVGDLENHIKYWSIANRIKWQLINKCWSEEDGIFYDLNMDNEHIAIKTISSLSPLFLEDLYQKYSDALVEHLINEKEFWAKYPVPSVAMDEPTFNGKITRVLWRGQSFTNTNWLLSMGLRKNGYAQLADELDYKTINMILMNEPYEFFSPLTGKGGGMKNLGWNSLILDMIMS